MKDYVDSLPLDLAICYTIAPWPKSITVSSVDDWVESYGWWRHFDICSTRTKSEDKARQEAQAMIDMISRRIS